MYLNMLIIVEHLEEFMGPWILIEYRSAYEHAKKTNIPILFTGIKTKDLPSTNKRFYEIINPRNVVILDPQAEITLTPEEAKSYRYFVIGGILGDHPPRGRTKKLLSDKFPEATKRNIGKKQFSVDGAVYILTQILRGRRLEEIPIAYGVRIFFLEDLLNTKYIYLTHIRSIKRPTGSLFQKN